MKILNHSEKYKGGTNSYEQREYLELIQCGRTGKIKQSE